MEKIRLLHRFLENKRRGTDGAAEGLWDCPQSFSTMLWKVWWKTQLFKTVPKTNGAPMPAKRFSAVAARSSTGYTDGSDREALENIFSEHTVLKSVPQFSTSDGPSNTTTTILSLLPVLSLSRPLRVRRERVPFRAADRTDATGEMLESNETRERIPKE